jgi:RNA polymerase sigma-70 factor (ECF subfamily)
LFRYAYLRVNDRQTAQDLVQETFLSALKSLPSFKGKSSIRTWLVTILKHKIIDSYRRTQSRSEHPSEDTDPDSDFKSQGWWKGQWIEEHAPSDWGFQPETSIQQSEFIAILLQCLAALPKRMAAVFSLREMDGLKSQEICKELDISSSNLWVMLHRARYDLRRCLEQNWFGHKKTGERSL